MATKSGWYEPAMVVGFKTLKRKQIPSETIVPDLRQLLTAADGGRPATLPPEALAPTGSGASSTGAGPTETAAKGTAAESADASNLTREKSGDMVWVPAHKRESSGGSRGSAGGGSKAPPGKRPKISMAFGEKKAG